MLRTWELLYHSEASFENLFLSKNRGDFREYLSGFLIYEDIYGAQIRAIYILISAFSVKGSGGFRNMSILGLFSAGLAVDPLYTMSSAVEMMGIGLGAYVMLGLFPGCACAESQKNRARL